MMGRNHNKFNLHPAEDAAAFCGISAERLLDLARAGIAPHVIVDGGEPVFQKTKLLDWFRANMMSVRKGMPMPRQLPVFDYLAAHEKVCPPGEISDLDNLRQIPLSFFPSGVYFLCCGGTVVYVGQTMCIGGRIQSHLSEQKKIFDSAFFIPVPKAGLLAVERRFIEFLKPKYNGMPSRFEMTESRVD